MSEIISDKEIHIMLSLIAMGDIKLIPESKIVAVIQEFKDLRARVEVAEQDKKRYWDAIHRQYLRNIGIIRKMEKAEQGRDNLQEQIVVIMGKVDAIVGNLKMALDPTCDSAAWIDLALSQAEHILDTTPKAGEWVQGLMKVYEVAKYRQEIKYKKLNDNHEVDVLMREEAENDLEDAITAVDKALAGKGEGTA